MEYVNAVAMAIGYSAMFLLVLYIIALPASIKNDENIFWITYFDIGFVYAKTDKMSNRLSKLRNAESQKLFIQAPAWFNRNVYNFGIRNEK